MKLIPLSINGRLCFFYLSEFDYDMKTMIGGNGIEGFLFFRFILR